MYTFDDDIILSTSTHELLAQADDSLTTLSELMNEHNELDDLLEYMEELNNG